MKTLKRKLGIDQLNQNIETFSNASWLSVDNKNLLNLVKEQRLNIAPSTLRKLDSLGLNNLEIISLAGLIGKRIDTLPTADIDFLNYLQDRFGIVFGYEEKQQRNKIARVDHFCGSFAADGIPMRSCALFGLDLYI